VHDYLPQLQAVWAPPLLLRACDHGWTQLLLLHVSAGLLLLLPCACCCLCALQACVAQVLLPLLLPNCLLLLQLQLALALLLLVVVQRPMAGSGLAAQHPAGGWKTCADTRASGSKPGSFSSAAVLNVASQDAHICLPTTEPT
jgi:hypothetical protein